MALAFAGKSVAASAISAIVRKSFDYLEKYTKAEGMKSVKERLERTLPQVQVIFDAVDMEKIRDQSEALDAWLWQLRDAVEDAEDVLDEVEYYKLEKMVKSGGNKVSSSIYKCKRLFVQQFSTTFKVGTYTRMVDAMKKLDDVVAGVERFILLVDRLDSSSLRHAYHQAVVNSRETTSLLTEETIIGRDTEKEQIIEWLIGEGGDNQNHEVCKVSLFGLVGLGGMGKTTLAQAVYNDQRVKQWFDHAMWVCVSNDFDVPALTKKIIQEITGKGTDDVTCLNTLHEMLRGKLSSKKFLLVFDDVWNDERRPDWEKLVAPLKFGQKGSKILLTTRMQSVVDIAQRVLAGGIARSMRLEGLQDNDLLALFNKHAFFGVNPHNYTSLQEISKQIIKKLSGSPLAAKVMGGLLNNFMDGIYWNKMLGENLSSIEHGNEGVMKVLRLSYQHLSPELQACFRYCSIFKEDYMFRKEELVNLWMGSGLIQPSADENQRPEDVGEYYLGILTQKSFFHLRSHERTLWDDGCTAIGEFSLEYYVLHDLLHELACTVSKNECIRISSDACGIIPGTVRHATITVKNHTVITDFSTLTKLRTLFICPDRTINQRDQCQWIVLKDVLNAATKLRVLNIEEFSFRNLPDAVGNLLHLRYLYHSPRLPSGIVTYRCTYNDGIYKLYHLQTLELSYSTLCCRLRNLLRLRHLYNSVSMIGLPPIVGRLTSLRDVRCCFVPHRGGLFAGDIQNLKDLHRLVVYNLGNINVEEAVLTKLGEKENLNWLSLNWQSGESEADIDERVLNVLQPHTNLARLSITGYNGSRSPCWMESPFLTNVTYIYLSKCHQWQCLPPLGGLVSLQYLYLCHMDTVKTINSNFYGCQNTTVFPSLKLLHIENLPALEEWVETDDRNMFPQLEALYISKCRALRNVPVLPSTLGGCVLHDVGLTTFPATYGTSERTQLPRSSHFKLKISHCANLVTLEQEHHFFGLEELHITDCENLLHLPMDQLQTLPSLKTFSVANCSKLLDPQEDINLPSSIKNLNIDSCGAYGTCFINSLCSVTSLATLQLRNCQMTTPQADMSLPSSIKNLCIDSCVAYETPLLNSLCSLTSLAVLLLRNCAMTHLPSAEVFRNLTTVRRLEICDCRELAALDGIEGLTNLIDLNVSGCDKLDKPLGMLSQQISETPGVSQVSHLGKLEKLRISNPFILQWEPLRRVNSVSHLIINESHKSLPEKWLLQNHNRLNCLEVFNATQLEFVPSIMASLTSLHSLRLWRAVLIQSLPELPASLEELQIIFDCHPVLERRCKKRRGCDWHKIAHIRDVQIEKRPSIYSYTGSMGYYEFNPLDIPTLSPI